MNTAHKPKQSWWNIIKSVFSAMLGVQSRAKAGQDFQGNNVKPFIIVGIIMVILFILSLAFVVNLILSHQ